MKFMYSATKDTGCLLSARPLYWAVLNKILRILIWFA